MRWRRNLESNPESGPLRTESVYRDLLEDTFNEIIAMLHDLNGKAWTSSPFRRPLCHYINKKTSNDPDKDVCNILYVAGLKSFQDILKKVERPYEYYTDKEINLYNQRIIEAMNIIIQRETHSLSDLNLNNRSSITFVVNN